MTALQFTKGHATQNDFVLVPDLTGELALTADAVRILADRRTGIGGDGVIRVVRTADADEDSIRAQAGEATWFMDYRNADGSVSEMCGNGARLFAAYLRREGLETAQEFAIATRSGVKHVRCEGAEFAVGLGPWRLTAAADAAEHGFDAIVVPSHGPELSALSIDLGNPHTVAVVPAGMSLADFDLTSAPSVTPAPPHGTNVELVHLVGPGHIAMRVHERGVGETRSCGTGACAAALATWWWDGGRLTTAEWLVDVPGGRLRVRPVGADGVELIGPAVLVADGVTDVSLLG
jgi:diaminopimelate epimerase